MSKINASTQVAPQVSLTHEFVCKTPGSRSFAERARKVMPDGISTDTRSFDPYGIYVERGSGARKWDVDGNEYLDFFGGHGALMLGHCHPRVTEAVTSAVTKGIQFAANTPEEVAWAERIVRCVPSAARVRFAGSGTEATLLAIRMARAFTGRSKLVRIATHYHGWHDFAASGYAGQFDGTPAPGVLAEIAANTILIKPGDWDALEEAVHAHRSDICAVLIEPVGAHFGVVPVSDDFVRGAFEVAKRNGILTILDEVISGFRVGPGGMQQILGIEPDLTCLAKVAAGGLPGGVLCGSEEVMSVLERLARDGDVNRRKVTHMGTFTGNPVTASAAIATIDEIVTRNLCESASVMGEHARARINEVFRQQGLDWVAYGRFSSFHILPGVPEHLDVKDTEALPSEIFLSRPAPLLQKLRMALNLEGVDIGSRGTAFASAIHTNVDIEVLSEAFGNAVDRLRAHGLIP